MPKKKDTQGSSAGTVQTVNISPVQDYYLIVDLYYFRNHETHRTILLHTLAAFVEEEYILSAPVHSTLVR